MVKMKNNKIKVMDKIQATMIGHERFNAYQGGYGVHKTDKHPNRTKRKADLRKELKEW